MAEMCVFRKEIVSEKMSKRRKIVTEMCDFSGESRGGFGGNYIALRIGRINSVSICLARMIWIFTFERVSPRRSAISS